MMENAITDHWQFVVLISRERKRVWGEWANSSIMHASKHNDPADNAAKLYHVLKVMTDRRRCKVPEGWLPFIFTPPPYPLYILLFFISILIFCTAWLLKRNLPISVPALPCPAPRPRPNHYSSELTTHCWWDFRLLLLLWRRCSI